MKILIQNEWIDFNQNEIEKRPYRNNFTRYYKNNHITNQTLIKFNCSKCDKEQTIKLGSFNNIKLCTGCKIIKTRLEKYGVENFFQIRKISEKAINNSHTKEARDKQKETTLNKYGVECILSNQEWKEQAMINKYGVKNAWQLEKVKENIKIKYLDKLKDKEFNRKIITKRIKTCRKKYGVDFVAQSTQAKKNFENKMLSKYGVRNPLQNLIIYQKAFSTRKKGWGIKKYRTKFGDNIHYQSKFEYYFIKDCELKNIRIFDGPSIKYYLNNIERIYHIDFETDKYLIEIKGTTNFYYDSLKSGEINAKNEAAEKHAASLNKQFLFLLNSTKYPL